jgi:tRNA pseudouridine(55) synthase
MKIQYAINSYNTDLPILESIVIDPFKVKILSHEQRSILIDISIDKDVIELYKLFVNSKNVNVLPDRLRIKDSDSSNYNTKTEFIKLMDYANKIIKDPPYPPDTINYNGYTLKAYHRVIYAWKQIGETPLAVLKRVKQQHNIPDFVKSCYAGRLDPMSQGLTILLTGSQNVLQQQRYNSCNKTYSFNAVLGISTESYDPLGTIENVQEISYIDAQKYKKTLQNVVGKFIQLYPPMSGYMLKGKPLWKHKLLGSLGTDRPSAEREVLNITVGEPIEIMVSEYQRECILDIQDVIDNCGELAFGGSEFIKQWQSLSDMKLYKLTVKAHVSCGTFIRSLVHDTGTKLGIPAHAFRITRTAINVLSELT